MALIFLLAALAWPDEPTSIQGPLVEGEPVHLQGGEVPWVPRGTFWVISDPALQRSIDRAQRFPEIKEALAEAAGALERCASDLEKQQSSHLSIAEMEDAYRAGLEAENQSLARRLHAQSRSTKRMRTQRDVLLGVSGVLAAGLALSLGFSL